jgi:AGCS family alanine or glycine:cation symporter
MSFFQIIDLVQGFLWEYVDFFLILSIGLYFSIKSRFFQFRAIAYFKKTINDLRKTAKTDAGVSPLRLYFTSIGGAIGLGNVVSVVTTVSIGGPGGVFWMWVAVFAGMLVKYGEVYLGILYRQKNAQGGYDGGPMYYLKKAFKVKFIAPIFCVFMCIYGAEIYQFKVIQDSIVDIYGINRWLVIAILILFAIYVAIGGVNRLAYVCSTFMPIFILSYIAVCIFAISQSNESFFSLFGTIFKSAFTGHAAVGGFAGSTIMLAIRHGMSNAVYSGDIGIGYDSVIQSETRHYNPALQARMVIPSLLTDCLICTLTVLLALSSNCWKDGHTYGIDFIVCALEPYFPHIKLILPIIFLLVGGTTVLGFLTVGMKSAKFLSSKYGRNIYLFYAITVFLIFSFVDQNQARLVMYLAGALLLLINSSAVFILRKEIDFSLNKD